MAKSRKVLVATAALCCVVGFACGVLVGRSRGIPFVAKQLVWSVGIVAGDSPFSFAAPDGVTNPVLTAADVTDVPAESVADPFMVKENDTWYMFFEVVNKDTEQGDIGLATSRDGLRWSYQQIVLDEPFHLSFPCVFKWDSAYYMVPESRRDRSVRLYKATSFPTQWAYVKTLLSGKNFSDPSVFRYDGKWWLFVETNPYADDTLRLYYADDLEGSWTEHPKSPLVTENAHIARPAGRVLALDDRIVRYAQDCWPSYGTQVWAFEVVKLSTTSYEERPVGERPVLKPTGAGWNGTGMHHIDPHPVSGGRWIASVDGFGYVWVFGLEY